MKVHLVNNGKWILGIISKRLLEVSNNNIEITRSAEPDYNADINYYFNWQRFAPEVKKSRFDIIWFSHLCGYQEIEALNRADLIIAKSQHGKLTLKRLGIPISKVRIFDGIGASVKYFKKIKLGFAGRLLYNNRKGESELFELAKNLDTDIFKFYLFGKDESLRSFYKQLSEVCDCEIILEDSDKFFKTIDYYLQTSYVEGGSMDIINAINSGTPIVSRDIGFFYDFKTAEDFVYNDFEDLLLYFKTKEESKLEKLARSKINTWDNFRDWHVRLFKEIYESQRKME